MAPATNSAKGLQQNRPRPAVPRVVVPAIPLPYVQKRQRQQEAAARAKAREDAVQTPPPPPVEEISSVTPPPTDATPSVANGSSDRMSEKADEISLPTSPERVAETTFVDKVELPEPPVVQMESTNLQDEPLSTPSEAQSAGSRSTYQMPPPFIPANQSTSHSPHPSSNHNVHNSTNTDSPRFPPHPPSFNGHHHMHHGHPSTSSLVFGGYPESNNSSPAPLSAGNFPPPPFPPHGHHPHHNVAHHAPHQSNGGFPHNGTNGFSPMGPPPGYYPRQDGYMNPPTDFPRRAMVSFGPPDGYSPVHTPLGDPRMNAFDPSTPHSFQGSQSSAPAEVENAPASFGQYPIVATSNGTNGHVDEVRLPQQPRQKPQTASQAPPSVNYPAQLTGQSLLPMDHLDGLVQYLQSQFGDPGTADYTLELRYSDDRAQPVRIPGHGLIFARSPTLKDIMSKQPQSDGYGRTLLIESESPFLRSDGFWMAVQRLYGGPLLDFNILAAAVTHASASQASPALEHGTPEDRFSFALGYASAGQILHIPPVVTRGIECAARLVSWDTVEKAVDFHLDGGFDLQWGNQNGQRQDQFPTNNGLNMNVLIHEVTGFLIKYFPPGFKLDTTAADSMYKPRLPVVNDERPAGHNPRLSFIKFGDHPSEEVVRSSASNAITTTLSRILLRLPFPLLKYVLESSRLGNVHGWATATLRQEVMHAVIEEREKRRIRVHSSNVSNQDRKDRSAEWEVVGWEESVQPFGGNEATPTLQRTWVDFNLSDQ